MFHSPRLTAKDGHFFFLLKAYQFDIYQVCKGYIDANWIKNIRVYHGMRNTLQKTRLDKIIQWCYKFLTCCMFLRQASFKRNKRKRKEVGAITYALHQSGLGLFALSAGFACFARGCGRCCIPRALQTLTVYRSAIRALARINLPCAVYSKIEHCLRQQEKKIEEYLPAR